MSYQVLARKWRPRFFREMVGQEHVLQALINALDHNRLHHAYLFTGTRGVGKTTIARILAKCLNCETGVSSEPCGQCSACREISEGCFIDLIEVDAASRTKVEDTRELLDNVQYAPSKGRFKIYLIDEVHMLSSHSFNALLKTLEEPPPHVKFLLATTDPQKLPATILSRCLQFHLKNMVPERIVSHLQHVLQQEMIDFEEPALWALARSADGSMRDALSLTDQAISFGSGRVCEAEVRAMLGTIDQQTVYHLAEALIAQDAAKVLAVIDAASEQSPDYAGVLDELLLLLHRMTIAQMVPAAIDNSLGDRERVLALAQQVSAEELQLFYQMGILGKRDLTLAPDLRSGLEMSVLRMLAFCPAGVHEPVGGACAGSAVSVAPAVATARRQEADPSAKKPEAAVAVHTRQQPVIQPSVAAVMEHPVPAAGLAGGAPGVVDARSRPALFRDNGQWLANFELLPFGGLVKVIAAECALLSVEQERWTFSLDRESMHLYNDKYAEQMADVLSHYFMQPVRVSIVERTAELLTPAAYISSRKKAAYDGALQELQADPGLQRLIGQYSARINPDSVEAIDIGEGE